MSRCLPFPPPGYEKNGLSGAALIEHIELERIKHEEKTRKRKEKRDRKHKKSGKSGVPLRSKEERREDGAGHSDGSDVTAEHEQAVVSGNFCSDETYGPSMKRGREISCHGDIGNRGKIIRIKLPVQRHNERDVATLV
uniref:Uncharacterized protein n=1 Tax=Kalanchoe fedtschenkoi TaxID=63787 RepID=A0A7N0V240_KALFE